MCCTGVESENAKKKIDKNKEEVEEAIRKQKERHANALKAIQADFARMKKREEENKGTSQEALEQQKELYAKETSKATDFMATTL